MRGLVPRLPMIYAHDETDAYVIFNHIVAYVLELYAPYCLALANTVDHGTVTT